jgi:hypothetical protein
LQTPDGYKIDWKNSVGYNSVSVPVFRAEKSTSPVRMHLHAQLDDYYNYEFDTRANQRSLWSIRMDSSDGAHIGHGYVSKTSRSGNALYKMLQDGAFHKVTASLKFTPNSESSSHFSIHEVHSLDDWAYSP